MNKIGKFLKDNKGSFYSSLAVKQLLVKFIELMSEEAVVKAEVSDIKALSPEVLDSLEVGDVVQKITDNQKHCYIVSYKGEGSGEGICLTYCAAGYMETVSYDRSGSSWVYNSTDVVESLPENLVTFISTLYSKLRFQGLQLQFTDGSEIVLSQRVGLGDAKTLYQIELNGSGMTVYIEEPEVEPGEEPPSYYYRWKFTPTGIEGPISSGNATSGKVLTADGQGGSSWLPVYVGTHLYKHSISFDISAESQSGRIYIVNNNPNDITDTGGSMDLLWGWYEDDEGITQGAILGMAFFNTSTSTFEFLEIADQVQRAIISKQVIASNISEEVIEL